MKPIERNTLNGLALVALGVLALLWNAGLFAGLGDTLRNAFGALLFAGVGAVFVRMYVKRDQVWALPAAFALFGLATAALVDGPLSGGYFLGLAGAGFVALFAVERKHWWAIIPGGALMSLGLVAALDEVARQVDSGPVLFIGLALTFASLWSVGQRWAIWPAIVLGAIALVSVATVSSWLLPVILIAAGAFLLFRRSAT